VISEPMIESTPTTVRSWPVSVIHDTASSLSERGVTGGDERRWPLRVGQLRRGLIAPEIDSFL
jgi:hypothetical protein